MDEVVRLGWCGCSCCLQQDVTHVIFLVYIYIIAHIDSIALSWKLGVGGNANRCPTKVVHYARSGAHGLNKLNTLNLTRLCFSLGMGNMSWHVFPVSDDVL